MIWPQAALCFLLWLGYGLLLRRRSEKLRERLRQTPRRVRVLLGSVGLLGSALLMLAGLYALAALGGMQDGTMTLWAWPIVAVLGIFFVHMQVLGAAAMITLVQDETRLPRPTSVQQKSADAPE